MAANIEKIFSDTAEVYARGVDINRPKYQDVFFGSHLALTKVGSISAQLFARFNEQGGQAMCELAKKLAEASLPKGEAILVVEFYARMRDAFNRERLEPLPELETNVKFPRFPAEIPNNF